MSKKAPKASNNQNIIEKADAFFDKRSKIISLIIVFIAAIVAGYLFDLKVSIGGDDSTYIVNAKRFIEGTAFPSHLGAGYPMLIGLPIALFGINLAMLKIISYLLVVSQIWLLFLAFRNRMPSTILYIVLFFIAVNAHVMYFASQTYSEALYMFLQAANFLVLFKLFDQLHNEKAGFNQWKLWLLFGFLSFYLGVTRMVGYGMLMAVVVYFLLDKKTRASLFAFGSFMVFFIPYTLFKKIVWSSSQAGRIENVLYKNVYNKAAGKEDFAGMLVRFSENAKGYIGKHLMHILGLKDPTNIEEPVIVVLLVIALFLLALVYAFIRKHKYMKMLGLYLGAAILVTFFAIQQTWDQQRLILIYTPLILFFILYGIYELAKEKNLGFMRGAIILFLVVISFKALGYTAERTKENKKVLSKNIAGNKLYGFTPDWMHFLQMSEWAAEKVPETSMIGSRKPSMSFIYSGGRDFHGIYKFPLMNTDTALKKYSEQFSELVFINSKIVNKSRNNLPVYQTLLSNTKAFVSKGNDIYYTCGLPDLDYANSFKNFLNDNQIGYVENATTMLNDIKSSKMTTYTVSPDTLVNTLKKANVDFVIMASLRVNPRMKTERTINTIRRYIYFSELKYPGMFQQVNQIGKPEDEPAWLYRINYSMYGLDK